MEARVVIGHRPTYLWKQEWWWPPGNSPYESKSCDWPPAISLIEAGVVIGHRPTQLWKHMAVGQHTCWKQELTDSELETSLITGKWLSCRNMWAMIPIETQTGTGTYKNSTVPVHTRTKTKYHMWCQNIAFPELDALKNFQNTFRNVSVRVKSWVSVPFLIIGFGPVL